MKRPITDAEIDRLLTARVRGTRPEFERRLADLSAEVERAGPRRQAWWWSRAAWAVGPLAAAASVALWLQIGPAAPPEPDFDLLFGLEESLAPAAALLEADNRSVLLEPELLSSSLNLPQP